MTISALHLDDITQLSALQPPDWPDILPPIKFYVSSPACFPVKAMAGDRIAGIGASLSHGDTAWLAHIIVHPEHRKKGIGHLITQTLVDDLRAKGRETIYLIATDLGAPVYTKIGFKTETEYIAFRGPARPPAAMSRNIVPFNDAFREPLLQLDRQVTGEDRATGWKNI